MDNFNVHKWLRESYLKETIDHNNISSIDITYTDRGKFYGVYVHYKNKDKIRDKIGDMSKAEQFLSDLGVKLSKNPGELAFEDVSLPSPYNEEKLNIIVSKLEDLGIKASHNDAFDPS